jgi:hypothetical protein
MKKYGFSVCPESKNFVKRNNIGYVLEDYDINTFIDLLNSIDNSKYDEMRKNVCGIKKAISWDSQEKKLLAIYRNL